MNLPPCTEPSLPHTTTPLGFMLLLAASAVSLAHSRGFLSRVQGYYLMTHQRHRRKLESALLLRPFHQPELTEKLHLVEVEPVAGDDPIFDCRDIASAYPHGFACRWNSFPRGAL